LKRLSIMLDKIESVIKLSVANHTVILLLGDFAILWIISNFFS
jgi:hypothetical protein